MGQTLSHGVYLPNEGERNCYAGLASNWQILNTAVGAIAEKAPLVHTHGNITNDGKVGTTANVPLITGTGGAITAGAFGNQANTFCEGNDSRLSDARTPVAHTHTKSDVTDLFNSGNTWTAQNTYTATGDVPIKITNNKDATNPSASEIKHIRFVDKNTKIIGGLGNSLELGGTSKMYLYSRSFSSDGSSNSTHGLLIINNKQTGVREVQSESNFIPSANNSYDLGSSSYQWNNLYAKNYYYNGVAWGLDKVNTWTAQQNITGNNSRGSISIYNPAYTKGSALSSTDLALGSIYMGDGGQQGLINSLGFISSDLASNGTRTLLSLSAIENTASSGARTNLVVIYDKNDAENPRKVSIQGSVIPHSDATFPLGTSTVKWKSLNGINPGALSLPGTGGFTDIKGDITNLSGGDNTFTAPYDGWVCVKSNNATVIHIINTPWAVSQSATQSTAGTLCCFCPVMSGQSFRVIVNATSLDYAYIHPCKGNV